MIANNIFKAIAEFCQNVLFYPFKALGTLDSWWLQSIVSWVFIGLTFIAFFYWLGELNKFKNTENE